MSETRQFWLAKVDQYGNPTLTDGAHSDRAGVERAIYLFGRLGLGKGNTYRCAEVILTDVEPKANGANEEAIRALNETGLKP